MLDKLLFIIITQLPLLNIPKVEKYLTGEGSKVGFVKAEEA